MFKFEVKNLIPVLILTSDLIKCVKVKHYKQYTNFRYTYLKLHFSKLNFRYVELKLATLNSKFFSFACVWIDFKMIRYWKRERVYANESFNVINKFVIIWPNDQIFKLWKWVKLCTIEPSDTTCLMNHPYSTTTTLT